MNPDLEPSEFTLGDIDLIDRKTLFQGRGRVESLRFRHRRHDGRWSAPITRELYTPGKAAQILIWDPDLDAVLLVEQCRPAGLVWAEPCWTIEAVAGMVDAESTAESTARREAFEESACEVGRLIEVATVFDSPGASGAKTTLFCGTANLSDAHDRRAGLANEHEDIRTIVAPLTEAARAADEGMIGDAKTVALIFWLARNKERLTSDPLP